MVCVIGMITVLCLDDDELIARMCARMSTVLGHKAFVETNSLQAITKHMHASLSVAIVDFKMPHLDGIDVLAAFQQSSPRTRRVLLTASPEEAEVTEAVRIGIVQKVLKKPVTFHEYESVFAWLDPE